jgi:pimeloyl-ACP methyl ester carboxylesterase
MEFFWFSAVLVIMAIIFVTTFVKIVPQGRQYTLERFGRYLRTLQPGIHFITPIMDQIGRKISMMESVLDVPRQEVITRDNVMVRCDAVVFTQVFDAAKADPALADLRALMARQIKVPTLALCGGDDLRAELMQAQAQYFDNEYDFKLIANAGHFLHREQPQAVTQELLDWFKK